MLMETHPTHEAQARGARAAHARRVEVWCRGVSTDELWSFAAPHLAAAGFEGPRLAEGARAPWEFDEPWEHVRLGGKPVFLHLGPMSEGCVLLAIMRRAPVGHAALPALWEALLRDPPRWLGECIVGEEEWETATVLIHSFGRLSPTVKAVDGEDGALRWIVPGDADYWPEMGRARHFLADWLLAEEGTPSPDEIAARYGASVERVRGGVVLDGGWAR